MKGEIIMEKLYGRDLMIDGCNCAQAVLVSLCQDIGLSEDMAMKLSCPLGGGCRAGEICGTVTGALLALGFVTGNTDRHDKDAREEAYKKYIEFDRRFKEKYGSLVCREILGCDTSTPEGKEHMKNHPELKLRCHERVDGAIALVREMLAEEKSK